MSILGHHPAPGQPRPRQSPVVVARLGRIPTAGSPSSDDERDRPGPYIPSFADERDAAELLNDDGPSDSELDAMALDAAWVDAVCSGAVL